MEFALLQKRGLSLTQIDRDKHAANLNGALTSLGCSEATVSSIFKILAGILWLGEVLFVDGPNDIPVIEDKYPLQMVAWLLEIEENILHNALAYRNPASRAQVLCTS
jgi:myosin heavy subunit